MDKLFLKKEEINTSLFHHLFEKLVKNEIDFSVQISFPFVCSGFTQQLNFPVLQFIFMYSPVKVLEKNIHFLQKHAQHPAIESVLFHIGYGCKNVQRKMELWHRAGVDINCMAREKHTGYLSELMFGTTPIMRYSSPPIIKALLHNGADLFIKSQKKNFMGVPIDQGAYDAAKELKQHGRLKLFQTYLNEQEQITGKNNFSEVQRDKYTQLKNILPDCPKEAYKKLIDCVRENNIVVLEHLEEFKDLIENYKNKKYNRLDLIFYSIKYNQINWLEKLWQLKYLPQNTITTHEQTYLEQALNMKKHKISEFLLNHTDFSLYTARQIEKIENFGHSAHGDANRRVKLQHLGKIIEKDILAKLSNTIEVKKNKIL